MRGKFLVLCLLLSRLVLAADVQRPGAALYQTVESSIIWNNLTNQYVMDATSPSTGVCLTFINNAGTAFGFNLSTFVTPNAFQTAFTGSTGKWTQVPLSPPAAATTPQFTVPASGTLQEYVRIPSASHFVLNFSNPTASASNTVTIFATQTPSTCGGVNQWETSTSTAAGNAANTSVAGISGVRHVANSIAAAIVSGATAGTVTIAIRDTTNTANCTTGTVLWLMIIGAEGVASKIQNVAVAGLNLSTAPGNAIQCCASAGIVAAIQSCSISGYDQ